MTCAHRIEIMPFHQQNIRFEKLRRHRMAVRRVVLVQVHAADRDGSGIHAKCAVRRGYANRAQSDTAGFPLQGARWAVSLCFNFACSKSKNKNKNIHVINITLETKQKKTEMLNIAKNVEQMHDQW